MTPGLTNRYRTATRYGLTRVDLRLPEYERLHESGWRQVWRHSSGALAMRHPISGDWMVSMDGYGIGEGWSSSLRAAARSIERRLRQSKES